MQTCSRILLPHALSLRKGGSNRRHRHLVFGKGARLVRTDAGATAERFHRGEFPHHRARTAHAADSHGENDGDDRSHALGDRRHCDCDRRHEIVEETHPPCENSAQKEQSRHRQHGDGDNFSEFCDRPIKGRGCGRRGVQKVGDPPHLGVHARLRDDATRRAAHAKGAHVHRVFALRKGGGSHRAIALCDGFALPRKGRFVGAEPLRLENAAIGGHAIPLREFDHIPRDEFSRLDDLHLAVPHRLGSFGRKFFEFFDGGVGAVLLDEPHHRVEENDGKQNAHVGDLRGGMRDVCDHPRKKGGAEENDRHEVLELCKKQTREADFFAFTESVLAVYPKPRFRFGRTQPAASRG